MRLDRGETASQPWPRIARGLCLTTDYRGMGIHLPALPPLCSLPSHSSVFLSLHIVFLFWLTFALFTTVSDGVNCPVAVNIPFKLMSERASERLPQTVLEQLQSVRVTRMSRCIETNRNHVPRKHRLMVDKYVFKNKIFK